MLNMKIDFPYQKEDSSVFEEVKRPRIKFRVFSETNQEWIIVDEALADTGADFCMLPRYMGEMLIKDITTGKYAEIKGVVPGAILVAYLHNLRIKLGDREINTPIAIADSDDTPCIFGRVKALDLFDANFSYGETTKLSW